MNFIDKRTRCSKCGIYHYKNIYHIHGKVRTLENYNFFRLLYYYYFTKQRPEFYKECKKELGLRWRSFIK